MATTLPTLATNLTNDSQPLHTVTSSCLTEPNRASIYAFTIAYALTFLVALAGNAEVIRNASRHGINGRRPFDKLIINMAVADTLDAFTGLPLNTVFLHFGLKWFPGPFGVFLCKAVYFCMNVSVAASVFTFTFIAVDRFRAIVLESKRPFSNTAVNLVIATVWFIASLLFAHDWLVLGVHEHRGVYYCYQSQVYSGIQLTRIEMTVMFLLTYAIPLPVAGALYSIMIRYLWKWRIPGLQNEMVLRRAHGQKKRMTKILLTILVAFAVCWLPVHVLHFISTFNVKVYRCIPVLLEVAIIWLAHANSAINPCLYLYMTTKGRRGTNKTKPTPALTAHASPRSPATANFQVFYM